MSRTCPLAAVSPQDESTIRGWGFDDINILLLNGNYYSQGLEGNTTYAPNYRGNIFKSEF